MEKNVPSLKGTNNQLNLINRFGFIWRYVCPFQGHDHQFTFYVGFHPTLLHFSPSANFGLLIYVGILPTLFRYSPAANFGISIFVGMLPPLFHYSPSGNFGFSFCFGNFLTNIQLIPNILLIVFNVIFVKKHTHFIFKIFFCVMCFLIDNICFNILDL